MTPRPLRGPPPHTIHGSRASDLSDREVLLVAALSATGLPVTDIARRLGLNPGAVRTALEQILRPKIR